MFVRVVAGVLACLIVAGCSSSDPEGSGANTTDPGGDTAVSEPTPRAESETVWLCGPEVDDDPCLFDETITEISADGRRTVESPEPAADPPVDCFYVYPTVSTQDTGVANRDIDPELIAVAHAQASRFSQVCRVFAPVYRQRTIAALFGTEVPEDERDLGYQDVRTAWAEYLDRDNEGRGVILIGHSQGTGVLTRLLAEEIEDDETTRDLVVSAMLLGGSVTVAEGADVGGSFEHLPICTADDQTGCVVAYSAFADTPVDDAFFGRHMGDERMVCTNPADLAGGGPSDLRSAFVTGESLLGSIDLRDEQVETPWVGYPGLFTGQCRSNGTHAWFEISENHGDDDGRPELTEPLGDTWGLHLVDVNVALGDLVDLARSQADAHIG